MELKAYAKINWDLHVLGRRPDGFHALDMVMVNVSLCDTLAFSTQDSFEFTCSDPSLPTDGRNLVVKAAELLARAASRPCGAKIHLQKSIPPGGGMGGGSSDAACALRGLNTLWGLNWPIERLHPLAAELGSDVAFFLYGGWRRCLGRGEIVEALPGSRQWPQVHVFLVMPPLHVATPAVYKALRAPLWDGKSGIRDLSAVAQRVELTLQQLAGGVCTDLGSENDLTAPALEVQPTLALVRQALARHCPGRWLMSGSGAVHFAAPLPGEDGAKLRAALTNIPGLDIRVVAATTCTPEL
ncbi:MAG: 4-(cytidine 5'-diphospho)-2-C-methyl-D-erythritol kinase [Planctomycetota bacterium]|nr:4-(cytidine 5'-diphospho)-2-C-methyl-D-erythritol kinase [Planctomycetota bacterium]